MTAVLAGPATADSKDYFRAVVESRRLEAIRDRFVLEHPEALRSLHSHTDGWFFGINDLQMRYVRHLGDNTMSATADQMRPWIDAQMASFAVETRPEASARTFWWLTWGYLASTFVALAFLVTRLWGRNMRVWPELLMPRLLPAAIAWPVAVWIYPSRVNPLTQAKRAMQFVRGLMATAFSLGVASGAYASDRKTDQDGAVVTTLTVTEIPKPAFSLSGGIMSQKVIINGSLVHKGAVRWFDANVSYRDWNIDYWGSRALSGDRGSDENDYTVSRTWTHGSRTVAVGLAFFDIRPLGSRAGGDMLSPFVAVNRSVGHGVAVFGNAEVYVLTGGPSGRNGYDVSVGVKYSHPIGKVAVDLAQSAVYADGPFGAERGVLLRSDVSATIPLVGHLKGLVSAKVLVPFLGMRDRRPTATANLGVAYAF